MEHQLLCLAEEDWQMLYPCENNAVIFHKHPSVDSQLRNHSQANRKIAENEEKNERADDRVLFALRERADL